MTYFPSRPEAWIKLRLFVSVTAEERRRGEESQEWGDNGEWPRHTNETGKHGERLASHVLCCIGGPVFGIIHE